MLLWLCLLLAARHAPAQLVADGQTNTLNGVTNTVTGNVTVGTNGSFTLLTLTNGARLTNTLEGEIGLNTGANSNTVWLTGPGTSWLLGRDANGVGLYVGNAGAFNTLVISNGAALTNQGQVLIGNTLTASNNSVVVTGLGSQWSNSSDVSVGWNSSGNTFVISGGAKVTDVKGNIGVNGGGGNLGVVSGIGSVWSNNWFISVGVNDLGGDALIISNGGAVISSQGGTVGNASTATNNLVLVTGSGSVWSTAGLNFGYDGGGNRLIISNGGAVLNSNVCHLGGGGLHYMASNNLVVVTGNGSVWTNDILYFGEGSVGNLLSLNNGGKVLNNSSTIGDSIYASNNVVVVSDRGSVWNNSGSFFVGGTGGGEFNSLVVSNGGQVFSSDGALGKAGNYNLVVVTGAGSLWGNSSTLFVGQLGSCNTLLVSNGGKVFDTAGTVGVNADANSNLVFVSGTGSLWSNSSSLTIGSSGAFNQLVISNGGVVLNTTGTLGTSANSSNNLALVTGAGSVWSNNGTLTIGNFGPRSQLIVSNGGSVFATGLTMGAGTGTGSNRITVAGGNLVVTNSSGTAVFLVNRGTNVFNSGNLEADQLVLTNVVAGAAHGLFQFNGGTLVTRGGVIGNGSFNVGVTSLALGPTNTEWRILAGVGSLVVFSNVVVGPVAGANSNLVQITGGTLVLTNAADNSTLDVRRGTNRLVSGTLDVSRLVLTNGGAAGGVFEFSSGTLTSRGTTNANGLAFTVGNGGSNALFILAGTAGHVFSNGLVVSTNAEVRLGTASQLPAGLALTLNGGELNLNALAQAPAIGNLQMTAPGALSFGTAGTGQTLTFSNLATYAAGNFATILNWQGNPVTGGGTDQLKFVNSGTVTAPFLNEATFYGYTNGALLLLSGEIVAPGSFGDVGLINDNEVRTLVGAVNGPFDNAVIGTNGALTCLTLTNSAMVSRTNAGVIGWNIGSDSNCVIVTGSGSRWLLGMFDGVGGGLTVGSNGMANRLIIENGGGVTNQGNVVVGAGSTSSNNLVQLTGAASVFRNLGFLTIGATGAFNTVSAGAGWLTASNVFVGSNSSGSRLVLSNGAGFINAGTATVGDSFAATSNSVLVTGAGSVWTNGGALIIGNSGAFNQFVVSSGGVVRDASGAIGNAATGDTNLVLVTGSGSVWSNSAALAIGGVDGSSANQMVVSNGGAVFNTTGTIGTGANSSNNLALVTGLGSLWSNTGTLTIGNSGPRTLLTVNNGGTVIATALTMGALSGTGSNRITIAGGKLIVTNSAGSAITLLNRGTNVLNSGYFETDQLVLTNKVGGLAQGVFEFNGGTLVTRGTTNANGLPFTVGNGSSNATFQLLGGTHFFSNGLVLATNSVLNGTGTILGAVTNFGTIAPGSSPGALRINGSLSLRSSANLSFEIGGLLATNQYDVLNVTSFVELAGTLSLSLLNGFYPAVGDAFSLLNFASATGAFTNATSGGRLNTVDNLGSFLVTITPTNVVAGGYVSPDSDGDGQSDYAESLAGTNPTNSASVLALVPLSVSPGGALTLRFPFVAGKSYRILWSDNLASGAWNVIAAPGLVQNVAGFYDWLDDGTQTGGLGVTTRAYRVGLGP
ncbi:MAG: hypothetical protein HY301_05615 [Verrucomicrobia bacterium]|nr:hypothetical protein [Verrucomicrobiota bacterium]